MILFQIGDMYIFIAWWRIFQKPKHVANHNTDKKLSCDWPFVLPFGWNCSVVIYILQCTTSIPLFIFGIHPNPLTTRRTSNFNHTPTENVM